MLVENTHLYYNIGDVLKVRPEKCTSGNDSGYRFVILAKDRRTYKVKYYNLVDKESYGKTEYPRATVHTDFILIDKDDKR